MLTLPAWLQLVGFHGRNPFADKQADDERDWLEKVFVAHPAFEAMLHEVEPHSSILHARRGAGKTTTCTMFERICIEEAEHRRPLVVRFSNWIPLVDMLDWSLSAQVNGYLEALFQQIALALTGICDAPWVRAPGDVSLLTFLRWFCERYTDLLTDQDLARLRRSQLLRGSPEQPAADAAPHRLSQQPPLQQLRWLLRALHEANVRTVYVLLDRVDEVAITVAAPERGADLLLPLLGNLELLELPGLVFKCFIPTTIVDVLRGRKQLRDDRIPCYDLSWDTEIGVSMLRQLLQNRLSHFSDGAIESLAPLAESGLRDIDDRLSRAAMGSPRQLLILSEKLLLARAEDATAQDLIILQRHLDRVIGAERRPAPLAERPGAPPQPAATDAPGAGTLLTLGADGRVARGETPIEGWAQLPRRQREVLRYLFSKPDVLCHYGELGHAVWRDSRISDDTVRKVLDRLIKFLHAGYAGPPYIEKVTGGYYVLRNAVAMPLKESAAQPPPADA